MEINRDNVLRLIQEKKWNDCINILKNNETFEVLYSDNIFKEIFNQVFVNEILNDSLGSSLDDDQYFYLSAIYTFHIKSQYNFHLNEDNFKKLVLKLLTFEKKFEYARHFPDEALCKEIINLHQKKQLDEIERAKNEHSKRKFDFQEFQSKSTESYVISIFKSPQELEFYKAALYVFSEDLLIPNASLSTVINNEVLNKLKDNEKWYFLTTTIDLVVVNSNDYKPYCFFELDSSYHDSIEQIKKDELKNRLISEAGFNLYRIRKTALDISERDYIRLINSILGRT